MGDTSAAQGLSPSSAATAGSDPPNLIVRPFFGLRHLSHPEPLLDDRGWVFSEPSPFNPPGNLRPGDAPTLLVDLTSRNLPSPRLSVKRGVVHVPAFTDLKLHDMCSGPDDANREPLDMQQAVGSPAFLGGTCRFLTRKLWGGQRAPVLPPWPVLDHAGGHPEPRRRGQPVTEARTLQILPPGTRHLIVNERHHQKQWPRHR